jgi:hypothetical protein
MGYPGPNQQEGSYALGLVLTAIFGCLALIPILIWGKPQTKKGSYIGFAIAVVLSLVSQVIMRM